MAVVKKTEERKSVEILELREGQADYCILGVTPFIYNCVPFHVKTGSTAGILQRKPSKVEMENTPKHKPWEEYRESVYRHLDPTKPTELMTPARMFKKAMRMATKDVPGLAGTEVGRLIWVGPEEISMFGIPQIMTTVMFNAGFPKSPDPRTRAILPQWACKFSIRYMIPNISDRAVTNLLANAGMICGVGDGRVEKGNTDFGKFYIVEPDNEEFNRILNEGAREAQLAALQDPLYYDGETNEILSWYKEEWVRGGWEDRLKKARSGDDGKSEKKGKKAPVQKRNGEEVEATVSQ